MSSLPPPPHHSDHSHETERTLQRIADRVAYRRANRSASSMTPEGGTRSQFSAGNARSRSKNLRASSARDLPALFDSVTPLRPSGAVPARSSLDEGFKEILTRYSSDAVTKTLDSFVTSVVADLNACLATPDVPTNPSSAAQKSDDNQRVQSPIVHTRPLPSREDIENLIIALSTRDEETGDAVDDALALISRLLAVESSANMRDAVLAAMDMGGGGEIPMLVKRLVEGGTHEETCRGLLMAWCLFDERLGESDEDGQDDGDDDDAGCIKAGEEHGGKEMGKTDAGAPHDAEVQNAGGLADGHGSDAAMPSAMAQPTSQAEVSHGYSAAPAPNNCSGTSCALATLEPTSHSSAAAKLLRGRSRSSIHRQHDDPFPRASFMSVPAEVRRIQNRSPFTVPPSAAVPSNAPETTQTQKRNEVSYPPLPTSSARQQPPPDSSTPPELRRVPSQSSLQSKSQSQSSLQPSTARQPHPSTHSASANGEKKKKEKTSAVARSSAAASSSKSHSSSSKAAGISVQGTSRSSGSDRLSGSIRPSVSGRASEINTLERNSRPLGRGEDMGTFLDRQR